MKKILTLMVAVLTHTFALAQLPAADRIRAQLPTGTVVHGNIPYNADTLQKHLLDLYLPADAKGKMPVVVFVHGGGWVSNDKYADMGYMPNTLAAMLNRGWAVASIDYRFAPQAVFPGLLQDCNRAVTFLYDHADKYRLDKHRMALMGFSAGGHLASLMGTSQNNRVSRFYFPGTYRPFRYTAVVDFYGPAELLLSPGNEDATSSESRLLGATPLSRPDLAQAASPITYIDKADPPFLIIHGEQDAMVSPKQSKLFSAWLTRYGVKNDLIIVAGAPHFGTMFDVAEIRTQVVEFLAQRLK